MLLIYKPSSQYKKPLSETLSFLKDKLHFKKGKNSQWSQLAWKNEDDIFTRYLTPLQELSLHSDTNKKISMTIPEVNEDNDSSEGYT